MTDIYRIRYREGDFEIEVESSNKAYVDAKLAEFLTERAEPSAKRRAKGDRAPRPKRQSGRKALPEKDEQQDDVDLAYLVAAVKDSDKFDAIEKNVLDKTAQVGRVLLCLYFANKELNASLTTGQIETMTNELGVRIKAQNVHKTLTGAGKKYVSADRVRRKGAIVKYKINRKGIEHFESLTKLDQTAT